MYIKRDTLTKLIKEAETMTFVVETVAHLQHHEQLLLRAANAARDAIHEAQQALDDTPPWSN